MKSNLIIKFCNAFWVLVHYDTLVQYFQDQHIPKDLGNKHKNHLKYLVGPATEVEVSPVTECRELKFLGKVHHPPPVTCQVSHVMCHMSYVTCHTSHVTCHMSHITFSFIYFPVQSGEASKWNRPHWADSVIESQCPYVCWSVGAIVCSFFRPLTCPEVT